MSDPYRTPSEPGAEEPSPASDPAELGALRSTHGRTGALGTAAVAVGGWARVDVHEGGLVLEASLLGRVEVLFANVDAVHYDFAGLVAGPPRVDLVLFDGQRISIPSDLDGLEWVTEAIERNVSTPLTRSARAALNHGERLVFGPLVLELEGIVLQGKHLAWGSLARVEAERDSLVFFAEEPTGRFGWVRLVDVPHPRLLLHLLGLRTTVVMNGLRL